MAAQHGDGCTAGGDGYASNRTAVSDDSEDRCCVDDPAAMLHEDVKPQFLFLAEATPEV